MTVLAGTQNGVFRVSNGGPHKVLDCGWTTRIRRFASEGIFVASETGLYRAEDREDSWTDLGVPHAPVFSVAASPDGDRLYAGTLGARLYVSTDPGDSWRELEGFQELPSRENWEIPRHQEDTHLRTLSIHPEVPNRLIADVEVGGVHLSEDEGETWRERREGVHDDIHQVLVRGPDHYVAATGTGIYRTENAGQAWNRLDIGSDHRYLSEVFVHEGSLYAGVARGPPGEWEDSGGADAVMVVSRDDGESFAELPYPGGPEEVALAWTTTEGDLVAGTNEGRIIRRVGDGWETVTTVSHGIRSLESV